MNNARNVMHDLMQSGQTMSDPRATGLGLGMLTWIALVSDSFAEALEYSEQSLGLVATPWDRNATINAKGCALVLLRRTEEGAKLLEEDRRRCVADGDLYNLAGSDGVFGVCKILQGEIGDGIRFLEDAIARRESEGYRVAADWYRLFLCEIYLEIIAGSDKPPFLVLLKNLPTLVNVMFSASARIQDLTKHVLENPQFDPSGFFVGRAQMTLGLLHKAKKKRDLALQYLNEAKHILAPFGQNPMLARLDAALAELGR
jgi:hypothetical protein